ncbi:MAG: hypothetical protein WA919_06475 [Coleofasciculaceae cyanobacterium]
MRRKTKNYIKNHVSQHGKSINNVLPKTFGFGIQDLEQALAGDREKLQQIGEAARQGKLTAELMPTLEQAYSYIIEGNTAYNTGVSRILKQAGKSSVQIDKGVSQVSLANQRYINDRREIKTDYTNSRDAENTRHKYALDYSQLKAYIDQYLVGVDHQGRMIDQANRPEAKQVAEDIKYDQTLAKHLIENGDEARPDLISYREYVPNQSQQQPQEKVTFASRINQIKSAFGF